MSRSQPPKTRRPEHPIVPTARADPLPRDRAFRALAAESPEVVSRLLVAAGLLTATSAPLVARPLPTGLDPPPPRQDVDFVGEVPDGTVLHVEWQGWRDAGVRPRVFGYHLTLVLRSAPATVRTVIIWSRRPTAEERAPYTTGQLTLAVDHLVLGELDPEPFLADPATACFAMACRTDDPVALAKRVAGALTGAPPRAPIVAALAAAAVGSYVYQAFVGEWRARGMEPIVIIEEVERMVRDMAFAEGEERGFAKGEERGFAKGEELGRREGEELGRREGEEAQARAAIADIADIIGIPLDEARRAWIARASLTELLACRAALKRDRAWPA